MTIQALYDSVAQLGFETSLESDERFFYAANRAILQVNRIRPAIATYNLNHFPLDNLIKGNNFEPICKAEEELVFVAEKAKSYYFECNGNGMAIIEKSIDGSTWSTIGSVTLSSQNNRFVEYKGFVLDGGNTVNTWVRLRFIGEYLYYVKNVALYNALLSDNAKDIHAYAEYIPYDFAIHTDDFMSFVAPPITDAQRNNAFVLNRDYFVEGESKLLIPASAKGVYTVCYNRKPKEITSLGMMNDEAVDLDEELCAILPNLVASYIWVEDEPEKANYYLSLYREQVAEITAKIKDLKPFVYRNKTGW